MQPQETELEPKYERDRFEFDIGKYFLRVRSSEWQNKHIM